MWQSKNSRSKNINKPVRRKKKSCSLKITAEFFWKFVIRYERKCFEGAFGHVWFAWQCSSYAFKKNDRFSKLRFRHSRSRNKILLTIDSHAYNIVKSCIVSFTEEGGGVCERANLRKGKLLRLFGKCKEKIPFAREFLTPGRSRKINYCTRKVRFMVHARRLGDTNPRSNARVFGRKFAVTQVCAPSFPYLDAIKLRRLILSISEQDSLSAPHAARGCCVRTHVMAPGNLVNPGIGLDVALEVNVDTFPNSARIQIAAKLEGNHRLVWKQNRHQSWSAREMKHANMRDAALITVLVPKYIWRKRKKET